MKTRISLPLLTLLVGLPFSGSAFAQSTAARPAAKARSAAAASTLPKNVPPAHGVMHTAYALKYIDTKIGGGELAAPNKFYTVQYTGWLAADGKKFDSSYDHGSPLTIPIGAHRVIPGWDTGFEGMHVGGKRRLFIPYQLAYGPMGHPPAIPAKADLIFDVELISISDKPPAPPTPPKPPTPPAGAPPAPGAPSSAPSSATPPAASSAPATPPAASAAPATPPAPAPAKPAAPPQ